MYPSFTPTDAEIIVIGAGISGMSTAFYILERDPSLTVLILEATNRIGGRTLSLPMKIAEGPHIRSFDFGGQFVSKSQVHLMDLLNKLGLQLVIPPSNQGKTIWNLEMGTIRTLDTSFHIRTLDEQIELIKFSEQVQALSKKVTFSNPLALVNSKELDSQLMEDFIVENLRSSSSRNFIRHRIRISCGVEPEQMSVLFYLVYCNASEDTNYQVGETRNPWIQGGAGQICQEIAGVIGRKCIKISDPVIEITRDPFLVAVETQNNIYLCKYAVVAIPPKEILDITFEPPLEKNRQEIIQRIEAGHLIKFVITYKRAFWRDKGFSGHIISCGKKGGHGPIHACYDITYHNTPALTGYIAASDCLEQPVETYEESVLQQLVLYFGEEALNRIDYTEKCWLAEPYTYNCMMNCPGLGNMDKYPGMRRPLGRLFWAGTEMATNWNGHMAGAVQAGYRAAMEVLYECRPQTLTLADLKFIQAKPKQQSNLTSTIVAYGTSWKLMIPAIGLVAVIIYFRVRKSK